MLSECSKAMNYDLFVWKYVIKNCQHLKAKQENHNVFSCSSERRHPAAAFNKVDMKKDPRRTLTAIRRTLAKTKYRRDLKMVSYLFG